MALGRQHPLWRLPAPASGDAVVDPGTAPDSVAEAASLYLWVEAGEDASTAGLSNGDPVSTWADLSAAAHDLTSTLTARPTFQTDVLNGLPVIRFDGTNDVLSNADEPNLNDKCLIIVVAQAASPHANFNTAFAIPGAGGNFHFISRINDALGNFVGMRNISTDHLTNTVLPVDGSFHILEFYFGPNAGDPTPQRAKIWVDGVLDYDEALSAPTGTHTDISIGSLSGTSAYLKGDIAAMAFYENAISEASMHEVAQYFAAIYGLTI